MFGIYLYCVILHAALFAFCVFVPQRASPLRAWCGIATEREREKMKTFLGLKVTLT